jgi:hypothetical protein
VRGKAETGATGVSCERQYLSRVFLTYFLVLVLSRLKLRRSFACTSGQLCDEKIVGCGGEVGGSGQELGGDGCDLGGIFARVMRLTSIGFGGLLDEFGSCAFVEGTERGTVPS